MVVSTLLDIPSPEAKQNAFDKLRSSLLETRLWGSSETPSQITLGGDGASRKEGDAVYLGWRVRRGCRRWKSNSIRKVENELTRTQPVAASKVLKFKTHFFSSFPSTRYSVFAFQRRRNHRRICCTLSGTNVFRERSPTARVCTFAKTGNFFRVCMTGSVSLPLSV
jgi:hypothetical protein